MRDSTGLTSATVADVKVSGQGCSISQSSASMMSQAVIAYDRARGGKQDFPLFFIPGAQALAVVRVLRILRVFRVLKLVQYVKEASVLRQALINSGRKILVFVFVVFTIGTQYCSWLGFLMGVAQHLGMDPDVPDFRQNSRTFTCSPSRSTTPSSATASAWGSGRATRFGRFPSNPRRTGPKPPVCPSPLVPRHR